MSQRLETISTFQKQSNGALGEVVVRLNVLCDRGQDVATVAFVSLTILCPKDKELFTIVVVVVCTVHVGVVARGMTRMVESKSILQIRNRLTKHPSEWAIGMTVQVSKQ